MSKSQHCPKALGIKCCLKVFETLKNVGLAKTQTLTFCKERRRCNNNTHYTTCAKLFLFNRQTLKTFVFDLVTSVKSRPLTTGSLFYCGSSIFDSLSN